MCSYDFVWNTIFIKENKLLGIAEYKKKDNDRRKMKKERSQKRKKMTREDEVIRDIKRKT